MEAASVHFGTAPARTRGGGRLLRLRTDDQLVALFRLGNDEAFGVIHDRYRARLLAYTRQMLSGSRADAEDALQDVFLRAYGALRADDRPVTLRAWLYRVAHNRCVDHMRRPANQPTGELNESFASLQDPTVESQRRDDLRRLVADLGRLPEQQRSALLMREMEGLTYAELADALGVTVPAIKSLLVRARIGLVEAREARDTACHAIRTDLAASHDRGVRLSGLAKRHVRECAGCQEYRTSLKGVREGIAALAPSPGPWAALLKLVGLGGAGTAGAASAGGGAASGGVVLGGGATAVGAKVAAIVCCAAVVGGGAVEVHASGASAARKPVAAHAPRAAPLHEAGLIARAAVARARAEGATHQVPVVARPTALTAHHAGAPRRHAAVIASALRSATGSDEPATFTAQETALDGSTGDDDARTASAAGGSLAPADTAEPDADAPTAAATASDPQTSDVASSAATSPAASAVSGTGPGTQGTGAGAAGADPATSAPGATTGPGATSVTAPAAAPTPAGAAAPASAAPARRGLLARRR